jgi:Flp pilus assembly protein TadG
MHRLATRLRTHLRHRPRGQSLVEFALVLPIILLLTLLALDFGRIYLGYINLQNMARVAANFAANNPDAWATNNTVVKTQYQNQIAIDAAATNCRSCLVGRPLTRPSPMSTATGQQRALVTTRAWLTCSFGVITPLVSNIVGNALTSHPPWCSRSRPG